MNALEQSMADFAAKHRLTSFKIIYSADDHEDYRFHAWAHFDDPAPGKHRCASGTGRTIALCLGDTLANVASNRPPIPDLTIADEPLPEIAA